MGYFKLFFVKFRYSHFLRIFFDALGRIGIRISPFYLFQEIISQENLPKVPDGFDDYEVGFWGLKEMKDMAPIPGRKLSEEALIQRLNDGHLCLGIKKKNELVAFTWCNLKEITVRWNPGRLEKNEAYLFDAYTLMAHRGKGIAPFLRYNLYQELQKLGRSKLYSYSDYFNTSAVKFKLKLNAKKIKLYLIVDLFDKWHFNFVLKDYQK